MGIGLANHLAIGMNDWVNFSARRAVERAGWKYLPKTHELERVLPLHPSAGRAPYRVSLEGVEVLVLHPTPTDIWCEHPWQYRKMTNIEYEQWKERMSYATQPSGAGVG